VTRSLAGEAADGRIHVQYPAPATASEQATRMIAMCDPPFGSAGSDTAVDVAAARLAPQRQLATLRGTRRAHCGQTRLKPVWS
jgi:hypothetical protein